MRELVADGAGVAGGGGGDQRARRFPTFVVTYSTSRVIAARLAKPAGAGAPLTDRFLTFAETKSRQRMRARERTMRCIACNATDNAIPRFGQGATAFSRDRAKKRSGRKRALWLLQRRSQRRSNGRSPSGRHLLLFLRKGTHYLGQ